MIKEGMYVRTKKGEITKIEKQCPNKISNLPYTELTGLILDLEDWYERDCTKASYDIIDLIEENDLVQYRINGDLYVSEVKGHPEFEKWKLHIEFTDTIINLEDLDIISILTKEQYEENSYRIGDDDL